MTMQHLRLNEPCSHDPSISKYTNLELCPDPGEENIYTYMYNLQGEALGLTHMHVLFRGVDVY